MAQVSDNEDPSQKLTKEELDSLVDYFEMLIQMDLEQKQKEKPDPNHS